MLLQREYEDVEEDVGIYRMNLRKKEYSVNWKTKQQINLCEQVALEGSVDRKVVTKTADWT
jgi:hypothetical protein